MGCTLVMDTSFGSTVGVVGHDPIVETDSRTHVERLQVNVAHAIGDAGLTAGDIDTIVVGVGPAPFTGLRAGIVTAKALAFATGARLLGQNVLDPQAAMMAIAMGADDVFHGIGFLDEVPRIQRDPDDQTGCARPVRHVTLCVNDARRKQLYFTLLHAPAGERNVGTDCGDARWIGMDIDYPADIVERVNDVVAEHGRRDGVRYVVDVVGHGAGKYAQAWRGLSSLGSVVEGTLLDAGRAGVERFASLAIARAAETGEEGDGSVMPLYLRRPDVSVPHPLKQVLNHAGAERVD